MDIDTLVRLKADVVKILHRYHEKEMYAFLRRQQVVQIDNLPKLSDRDTPHRLCVLVDIDDEDRTIFDRIYATEQIFLIPDEDNLPITKSVDVIALNGQFEKVADFHGPLFEPDTGETTIVGTPLAELLADEDDLRLLIDTLIAIPIDYEEAY